MDYMRNKWTIALKGISKKMEWIVSNIQSSFKTLKINYHQKYRKVMDSMSEDINESRYKSIPNLRWWYACMK